jgi:hypothetical protein
VQRRREERRGERVDSYSNAQWVVFPRPKGTSGFIKGKKEN